jgi:hypothetical protein
MDYEVWVVTPGWLHRIRIAAKGRERPEQRVPHHEIMMDVYPVDRIRHVGWHRTWPSLAPDNWTLTLEGESKPLEVPSVYR